MNAIDIDREMRTILERAQPHTVLTDTYALMALGFTPWTAFNLLEQTILAKPSVIMSARPPVHNTATTTRLHDWSRNWCDEIWEDVQPLQRMKNTC